MKGIDNHITSSYGNYLSLLKRLVSINTVYSNKKGIIKALKFCKQEFEQQLQEYRFYFDQTQNLIGISKKINPSRPIVYLSSHIDTVHAEKKEWHKQFDPFHPYEDAKTIVGRGVNDDKAGVAYQLLLAHLLAAYYPRTSNILFTISSREEQGGISAQEIGTQLGNQLPLGSKTYLITLENNIKTTTPPTLYINYGENGAFGMEVIGQLETLKKFLYNDINLWNPTSIIPVPDKSNIQWEMFEQIGGHAATVRREGNLIYQFLTTKFSNNQLIKAGSPQGVSNVPKIVYKTKTLKATKHKAIFDLRTMKHIDNLIDELNKHRINYKFVKKIDNGYSIKKQLLNDEIYQKMKKIQANSLQLRFEINPGSTDTGKIYSCINTEIKKSFIPITMGPGSRSQKDLIPPRMTHGVNETYVKKAGLEGIRFITKLLAEMNFIKN
ncbi:M20/M25/M40 family metallo-hydrolase [Candidatus Gottesmanbacteria bacterium]|nr:M20/M25/M40 family metallo-hydrolase [Candidatus Gottesmanbacteria bacterium]